MYVACWFFRISTLVHEGLTMSKEFERGNEPQV
jgi:hypothetical protein